MKYGDIRVLLPQRKPVLMVDGVAEAADNRVETWLDIRPACFFLGEDGRLEEVGLIEHIAQSASALAGYKALEAGASEPPVGYIAEVKKFHCYQRPQVGDRLCTTVLLGAEVGGVGLLTGETRVGDIRVATTQMKIFIRQGTCQSQCP